MATRKGPSPASAFKKKKTTPVELPSGNLMVLRRPGMERFLSAGYLPDKLAAVIRREIASMSPKPTKASDILEEMDENDITEMMYAMDRVAAEAAVEPHVCWHMRLVLDATGNPQYEQDKDGKSTKREVVEVIPEEERSEDFVYTDELELEDKQFIFQYAVGGSADLSRFRAESATVVDALQSSGIVELPSE